MHNCSILLQFKDTIPSLDDKAAVDAAVDNLAKQLIAAADKIKQDSSAVYSFITMYAPYTDHVNRPKPTPLLTPEPVKVAAQPVAKPIVNPEVNHVGMLINRVFEKLKRTEKSMKMIAAFAVNSGTDLTIERLVNDTGLSKNDVCAWLAQTGKKLPCVTNPARGVYKFDPDKL